MTPGDPHSPFGAGDESLIDEVLGRAAADRLAGAPRSTPPSPAAGQPAARLPRVTRTGDTAPQPMVEIDAAASDRAAPRPSPTIESAGTDSLTEVSWFDEPTTPAAGEPIRVAAESSSGANAQPPPLHDPVPRLAPSSVNRSAWNDELRTLGTTEPAGWDKLSWNDIDDTPQRSTSLADPAPFVTFAKEWGPVLLAAIVIAVITRLLLVQAYHIPSLSMAPTLQEGDRVIVNRLSYDFGEIERGQVIVFSTPPSQQSEANDLIKRVIGLPGETVQFREGQVFVDGLLLQESYIAQQGTSRARSLSIPGCAQPDPSPDVCEVPEGFVFVMGDNRTGSQDSRVFGPIPAETVVGRAMMRVWPLTEIGEL